MKLNREMIVAEAIALMRAEGLEAVSLRGIATRLDARAPSLARHVGDKQMLLALMSAHLFREALASVADAADWQRWALEFGRALWRTQQATRDIAKLIAHAPPDEQMPGSTVLPAVERLVGLGLTRDRAMILQSSVQALVTGWTGFVTGPKGAAISAILPVEQAVETSLAALVHGFAAHEGNSG